APEIFLPGDERVLLDADRDYVILGGVDLQDFLEEGFVIEIGVLDSHALAAVEVGGNRAQPADLVRLRRAELPIELRRKPQTDILVGRKARIEIGARDVERVPAVVAGSGRVDVLEESGTEAGVGVHRPIAVNQSSDRDLLEPAIAEFAP